MWRAHAAALIAAACVACCAASAGGATIVGSTLPSGDPELSPFGCITVDSCTYVPSAFAAGNVSVPAAGVITAFHAKVKSYVYLRYRVDRGSFAPSVDNTNVYRSGTIHYSVAGGGTQLFTELVRIPVQAGDRVGADLGNGYASLTVPGSSALEGTGDLVFRNGSVVRTNFEVLVNAVVEPDADHDGYGDETQDCQPHDPSQHTPCTPPPPEKKLPPGKQPPGGTPPPPPKIDLPKTPTLPVVGGSADVDTHCDVPPGSGVTCSGAHVTYAGVGPAALGGLLSTGGTLGEALDGPVFGVLAKAKRPLSLKVGSARFRIAAGKHKVVKIPLNRRARTTLAKRGKLKVLLVTTLKDAKGKLHTTRRTVTLRVKQRAKKTR